MSPQPQQPRRVTLADLSDDDRRALLLEAREEAKRNPTDVVGYDDLSERERVIRGLMDARDHMRGCPVQEGTDLGRVEGYDAFRPPNPATGRPAATIAVVRCIECGGTSVLDDPPRTIEEAISEHESELETVPAGGREDEEENP